MIERLNIINKEFPDILDLGCRTGQLTKLLVQNYNYAIIVVTNASNTMLQSFEHTSKLLIDEENLPFKTASFDLITFSLGLHWINDVQNFLLQIKRILKPNGIFIGNFIGGNSLKELRMRFIEAEIATNRPHFQHVSPFIHFDHVTPLLQQAGFTEVVVDYENIQLNYKSPLDFIRELKNIGESGALLQNSHNLISKQVLSILSNTIPTFTEQINIISFIASPTKNNIKIA
ncbi:MAG: methyltransferase domain-containing protein [Rickettsia sp.]|nr:methyltransferase domain-containing protein [Rickettsia sp.]